MFVIHVILLNGFDQMVLYLLEAMVLIVLGTIALLIVFIAKYWAPDRTVTELKRWQLPNSEFIDI